MRRALFNANKLREFFLLYFSSTLRLHANVDEYLCKNRALENELQMLRELSHKQEFMGGKVANDRFFGAHSAYMT